MSNLETITRQLVEALLRLDSPGVGALLDGLRPLAGGGPSLDDVVVPALERIGRDWEEGRVSLSQVYMAGRICERAVEGLLSPDRPVRGDRPKLGIAVLEDHHALGKRMVKSALRAAGYQLQDYGHGRRPQELVEMALRDQVDVLLISCLMLASALRVSEVVAGLQKAGSPIAVVVGGAPFRLEAQLWKEVGARAVGRNAAEAVAIVRSLAEREPWA